MSGSKAGAAKARKGRGRGGTDAPPAVREVAPQSAAPSPATAGGSAGEQTSRDGEYVVQLPTFEGPLDLLLHLIQQHELNILDIPVSFVTEKYLEYLKLMQSLSIDLASEYLVMAATLAHIKSKMLLPSVPAGQDDDGMPGEDEEDPRAELVRRLLEYQKYKVAAADLAERGTLGRDVFTRGMSESEVPKGPAPFAPSTVFSLLDAFEKVLKRANVQIDHEVVFDRISITDRIVELTEKLTARRAIRFEELLLDGVSKGGVIPKFEIVITFLAVLEMCKLKLIRVHQTDPLAPIHIELSGLAAEPGAEDEAPRGVPEQVAEVFERPAEAREEPAAAAQAAAPAQGVDEPRQGADAPADAGEGALDGVEVPPVHGVEVPFEAAEMPFEGGEDPLGEVEDPIEAVEASADDVGRPIEAIDDLVDGVGEQRAAAVNGVDDMQAPEAAAALGDGQSSDASAATTGENAPGSSSEAAVSEAASPTADLDPVGAGSDGDGG